MIQKFLYKRKISKHENNRLGYRGWLSGSAGCFRFSFGRNGLKRPLPPPLLLLPEKWPPPRAALWERPDRKNGRSAHLSERPHRRGIFLPSQSPDRKGRVPLRQIVRTPRPAGGGLFRWPTMFFLLSEDMFE